LCPECEARWRVTYEMKDSGRPGGGRKRSRQKRFG
jgi:hypothetical protein